jgi:hypothetical protein
LADDGKRERSRGESTEIDDMPNVEVKMEANWLANPNAEFIESPAI